MLTLVVGQVHRGSQQGERPVDGGLPGGPGLDPRELYASNALARHDMHGSSGVLAPVVDNVPHVLQGPESVELGR